MPPSSKAKLTAATDLYEEFSGHDGDVVDVYNLPDFDTGLTVGECDGILYTTLRDGQKESYIHKFKKSARPLLAASHDGASLALIGGNFNFTERGIVDN